MGTNCAPVVADLFLFCYERDFMMSLSDDKQANVIDAFNTFGQVWYLIVPILIFAPLLTSWYILILKPKGKGDCKNLIHFS